MDNIAERAVIQYLHKIGLALKDIHNDVVATLGNDVHLQATVKSWVTVGRQSLEDDTCLGKPVTSKVHDIVLADGKLRNSYIMGCPPVRGDNPRALASGLFNVQVDKHGITILYHLH